MVIATLALTLISVACALAPASSIPPYAVDLASAGDGQPVQCDIPVVSGLKTFVACAKGKDENTILGGWVPAMRKAGSVVVMTPLSDVTSLRKVPDGVFDLVVVEDGEDVDVDILNGVRCIVFSNQTEFGRC